jgi:choline dehydrogenase-like flavoprotein
VSFFGMNNDFDVVVIGGGIVGSYLAAGLARKGRRVALVERGGDELRRQEQALPSLRCSVRPHLGSVMARNHVLGGNGHYWGGGLIRPTDPGLLQSLGIADAHTGTSQTLAQHFAHVEEQFGMGIPVERIPFPLRDGTDEPQLSEITVLPSRSRNTPQPLFAELRRHSGCEILTGSELLGFSSGGMAMRGRRTASVAIRHQGRSRELATEACVIAAGTIDTNLIVAAHSEPLGATSSSVLGRCLHDHLSLPIASVRLGSNLALKQLLSPRFDRGRITGRRFELQCERGWGARGFLHFTFQFDEVTPYRELKQLMTLRQKRAPLIQQLQALPSLLTAAPALLQIARERMLHRRLHLAPELTVTATLDFETFPHPDNSLTLHGPDAELAWDIREQDEMSYLELLRKAQSVLGDLTQGYGMQVRPIATSADEADAPLHLRRTATDAFHLGGGLAAGCDSGAAVDTNLRLCGTENVYVVSAAVLARPGVVNPTLTLLALADRFVHYN